LEEVHTPELSGKNVPNASKHVHLTSRLFVSTVWDKINVPIKCSDTKAWKRWVTNNEDLSFDGFVSRAYPI
jgi:hypothetical protein